MKYILFSDKGYKIIETDFVQYKDAPNGRTLAIFTINKEVKKHGDFNDILLSNKGYGLKGFVKDDMFALNDTETIIEYIFNSMGINWWERNK